MSYVFRMVHDREGKLVRVELNGQELPTAEFTVDRSFNPMGGRLETRVRLTLDVDDVEIIIGREDAQVVDADPVVPMLGVPREREARTDE